MGRLNLALIITIAVLAITIVFTSMGWNDARRNLKNAETTIEFQRSTIDSLLNRRMTVFDVQLNVTDKSRFTIHGRYNKGTISVPSERVYELKIDSTRINLK